MQINQQCLMLSVVSTCIQVHSLCCTHPERGKSMFSSRESCYLFSADELFESITSSERRTLRVRIRKVLSRSRTGTGWCCQSYTRINSRDMCEEILCFRVQYLLDTDPFCNLSAYPVPSRAPVFSFVKTAPLSNQLGSLLRLLNAPQRVRRLIWNKIECRLNDVDGVKGKLDCLKKCSGLGEIKFWNFLLNVILPTLESM